MIDRRGFLGGLGAAAVSAPSLVRWAPPPRLSVYVYTRPLVRPRHHVIVQQALQKRYAEHTSGWGVENGKPRVAIGPVKKGAGHWRKDKFIKPMDRAWPFVVVVEYPKAGGPQVWLDWFRRATSQKSDGGWILDPGVGYAEHMNAQVVCGGSATTGMLACADTPTGTIVGGQQFALRARAVWADGTMDARGWWLWFDVSSRSVDDWFVERRPLSLRALDRSRRLTVEVENPASQLAVHNTPQIFTFPAVPQGVNPCR